MCSQKYKNTDKDKERERSKLIAKRAAAVLKARQEKAVINSAMTAETKRAVASQAAKYRVNFYISRRKAAKKELTKEEFAELIAKKQAYAC